MRAFVTIFKALRRLKLTIFSLISNPVAWIILRLNGVEFGRGLLVKGYIKVNVTRRGVMIVGNNFRVNSGGNFNVIGRQQPCTFWVEGNLTIGNGVGISSSAIVCTKKISIGNNVIIGGNTVIYDSDFHSLDPNIRSSAVDQRSAVRESVVISDNVFIGAHSTILKGVCIGENSVVGACSVVTKDIPSNEVWAGNPARLIKTIDLNTLKA